MIEPDLPFPLPSKQEIDCLPHEWKPPSRTVQKHTEAKLQPKKHIRGEYWKYVRPSTIPRIERLSGYDHGRKKHSGDHHSQPKYIYWETSLHYKRELEAWGNLRGNYYSPLNHMRLKLLGVNLGFQKDRIVYSTDWHDNYIDEKEVEARQAEVIQGPKYQLKSDLKRQKDKSRYFGQNRFGK